MRRNPAAPFLHGAWLGAVVALGLYAWVAAATALESVVAVDPATGNAGAVRFVADATSLWLLVVVVAAIGGIVLTGVTYGIGRMLEPEARRFPLRYLVPAGTLLALALGYATVRLGVTIAAGNPTVDGTVSITVAAMTLVVLIAGAITGSVTVPVVDALARPSTIGAPNEATPPSAQAAWRDMARAVGIPLLAMALIAIVAITLAQVLLGSHSTVVAVAVFAGVGALVLGATTLLALRPWEHDRTAT